LTHLSSPIPATLSPLCHRSMLVQVPVEKKVRWSRRLLKIAALQSRTRLHFTRHRAAYSVVEHCPALPSAACPGSLLFALPMPEKRTPACPIVIDHPQILRKRQVLQSHLCISEWLRDGLVLIFVDNVSDAMLPNDVNRVAISFCNAFELVHARDVIRGRISKPRDAFCGPTIASL
jgi:hypothetical protein